MVVAVISGCIRVMTLDQTSAAGFMKGRPPYRKITAEGHSNTGGMPRCSRPQLWRCCWIRTEEKERPPAALFGQGTRSARVPARPVPRSERARNLMRFIIAKITSCRKEFTGFFILKVSENLQRTGGSCERKETRTETKWDEKKTTTRSGGFQRKTEKFVEKSKKGVD